MWWGINRVSPQVDEIDRSEADASPTARAVPYRHLAEDQDESRGMIAQPTLSLPQEKL